MNKGQKIAKKYFDLGLNPVPIKVGTKEPAREGHNQRMEESEITQYSFEEIGVSTGESSLNLEVIDFDLKNAKYPHDVMEAFKSKVPKKLLSKMLVQLTQSGGYHFIYRCEDITSSKKLAKNPEGKAIIETRGLGGLIKCYPSPGYKLIQGTFDNIPIITPQERLQLFVAAKMLNQTVVRDARKRMNSEDSKYFKKFPDYNSDVNIGIEILENHGWTVHSEDSDWINLTRPGKTVKDGISAGYHKQGKFLFVFSTSQNNFEEERPYNNHAIFAELECGGNYKKAYALLYEQGHGIDDSDDLDLEEIEWEEGLKNITFLSDEVEENTYLEQARKGEVSLGLTTGWRSVDEYFRFKENSVNFGLGYDGVGKSVQMLSFAAASNVLHGWKWGMIMPENRTAMSRRRLIETFSGRSIERFKDSPILFDKYAQESRDNFKIITNRKHYTITEVLEMGKRLYEHYGIKALLIDPFNFFKVVGNSYSHNNEILSQMRVFAESYCSVYVMAHPSSNTPRTNRDELGYLKAPDKYSIQGGADFPYRVDDFFIVHRVVNHSDPQQRKVVQFIVEKVKETETGGKVHDADDYTKLVWETRDGFTGYWDDYGDNPMYKNLIGKRELRSIGEIKPSLEEAF